jgi:hypothetical protein
MDDDKYEGNYFSVDENHIQTMGLELICREKLSCQNMSAEKEKFVIASEMAVEHFQLGTPGRGPWNHPDPG